jgi:hypothetical protein
MTGTFRIPTLASLTVALVGGVVAGLGDWSAVAIYGVGAAIAVSFVVALDLVQPSRRGDDRQPHA